MSRWQPDSTPANPSPDSSTPNHMSSTRISAPPIPRQARHASRCLFERFSAPRWFGRASTRRCPNVARWLVSPAPPTPSTGLFGPRNTLGRRLLVQLAVYDIAGRRRARLVDQELPAGVTEVTWDGRDAAGVRVASGMYFVRLA